MKTIAVIPARYQSKRFPGKPLAMIAGKPMIQHVHERALSCPDLSDIFVATDDERIFQCVNDFAGKAIMTQKEHPSGTDRVAEAAQKMDLQKDDLIVNIQGDQPLFEPIAISQLLAPLFKDKDIHMSTLKYRIEDEKELINPNNVKVVTDREGFALFFSRHPIPFYRDSVSPTLHYKHLGLYGYRMDSLIRFGHLPVGELESAERLEQLRALEYGFRIKVIETLFNSIEVDSPEDIKEVEKMMIG